MVSHLEKDGIQNVVVAKLDTRKSYNQKIINMCKKNNITLTFSDPKAEKALQIADFYSWTVFSHLEKGDSEYFTKLKHQIEITIYNNAPEERVTYHVDRSPSGV